MAHRVIDLNKTWDINLFYHCYVTYLQFSRNVTLSEELSVILVKYLLVLKGYSTFLELGSFYNSPRVKQLDITVFESIQTIF